MEEAASGASGCATETSGIDSASFDLKADELLGWAAESIGDEDTASSIGAMICGAAFGSNVAFWALGSDDVATCCGAATFEVGELVSLGVAPANDSTFGAAAIAAASVSGDGAI
jgi:hypothetical protein